MKISFYVVGGFSVVSCCFGGTLVPSESFRIRDPFVLTDAKTQTYYLYGVEHYLGEKCDQTGVWVRKSKDLKNWSEPVRVKFVLHNPEIWGSEHLAIYDFTDDGEKIAIVEARETARSRRAIGAAVSVAFAAPTKVR